MLPFPGLPVSLIRHVNGCRNDRPYRARAIAELASYMSLTEEEVPEALDAANAYLATGLDAPPAAALTASA